MTTVTSPAPACASFPSAAVASCLREKLIEAIRSEASVKGIALPDDTTAIVNTTFQIDSLVVVSILCHVEPLVGFDLIESAVRVGGYESAEDALKHLLSNIEAQWNKRNRVQT